MSTYQRPVFDINLILRVATLQQHALSALLGATRWYCILKQRVTVIKLSGLDKMIAEVGA